MTFKRLMLPQPPTLEKDTRAFLRLYADSQRPMQEQPVRCALRWVATSCACLSFGGFCVRILHPANAEGRERCPSKTGFVSATELALILVASLRCFEFGTV